MRTALFKDIVETARKQGDTVILVHANGSAQAVMPFERYQELVEQKKSLKQAVVDTTEEINDEIAILQNKESVETIDKDDNYGTMRGLSQEFSTGLPHAEKPEIPFEPLQNNNDHTSEEDYFYIEPVE